METLIFLFLFLFFIFLWSILLKFSGVRILTISIPAFLIISIFIYQYLGYPILFFFLNDYRVQFVQDRDIILSIFLLTSYTITLIILGFVFAKKTFGLLHSINKYTSFDNNVIYDMKFSRNIMYLLFISSIIVLIIYISKIGYDNIALLSVINSNESTSTLKVLRSNMGNAYDGKYHWYRLFMRDILSTTSVAFFGFYLLRRKIFNFFIFIISFLISCFSMTMAIEKGPFLYYLISLFLMYVLIMDYGRFKIKKIIIAVLFGFFLIGFVYVNFMGSENMWIGVKLAISRILTGQIQSLYHYYEIFPEHIDFIWGKSFPNPGGLMPYDSFSLTKETFALTFPKKGDLNIVGSMPTFFWGEMYANFGYLGVILPPFFIGYFLYSLNIFLFRLQMTPIVLSFYIWIILHYERLSATALSKFIIDTEMFIFLFFLIFIISAPYNFKIKLFKIKNFK